MEPEHPEYREAAAKQLCITVTKHSANRLTMTRGHYGTALERPNDKAKFSATGDTSLISELVPVYAKKQLVKFAKAKGCTVSQGNGADEIVLTKYE